MTTLDEMDKIEGAVQFPDKWIVFAPISCEHENLCLDQMTEIPDFIESGKIRTKPCEITPTRSQYDFKTFFGDPPYKEKKYSAYVFLPVYSEIEQEVTLGFGADWYLEAWLNGECILDTTDKGNRRHPPLIEDYCVNATLDAGDNLLAVRFLCGRAGAVLAIGGPEELRRGNYSSLLPDPRHMGAAELYSTYPPDPQAPIQWLPPEGFDPAVAGLGLPPLDAAEHDVVFHPLPSKASLEDGGSGGYESCRHGTFNHNLNVLRFREHLLAVWTNHAKDEGGYGSRRLGCAGKILDPHGNIDWHGDGALAEITRAPMPVRRRKRVSDRDAIRSAEALGYFRVVKGRLFFFGRLGCIHGVTTAAAHEMTRRYANCPVPGENFFFGKRSKPPRGSYVKWSFGRFFQEWDIINDRLQPISPVYKESDFPSEMALTPEISLPLETLAPIYREAPLLEEAPEDFQGHISWGENSQKHGKNFFPPGTSHLAHDGQNGINLMHSTEFQRPDGSLVVILENNRQKNFYYASERRSARSDYPPPRRTSLYGSVNPDSGILEDGSVYIAANSPDRRNMFITVSSDGRCFNKSWLLLYKSLQNSTAGMHKGEGGAGSGPQYFQSAIVGQCLWLVYSIGKELIGATKVPVASLLS